MSNKPAETSAPPPNARGEGEALTQPLSADALWLWMMPAGLASDAATALSHKSRKGNRNPPSSQPIEHVATQQPRPEPARYVPAQASPARQRAVQLYRLAQRRSSARKRALHLRQLAHHPDSPARQRVGYLRRLAQLSPPPAREAPSRDQPAARSEPPQASSSQRDFWSSPGAPAHEQTARDELTSSPPPPSSHDQSAPSELTALYDQSGSQEQPSSDDHPTPEGIPSWMEQALSPQLSDATKGEGGFSEEELVAPADEPQRLSRPSRGASEQMVPWHPSVSPPLPSDGSVDESPATWGSRLVALAKLPMLALAKATLFVLLPWHSDSTASSPSGSTSAPPDGEEKRGARRIPYIGAAQLLPWPAKPRTVPIDVLVVDYSRTGVGILHDEGLIIGQQFILREPNVTVGSNTCMYEVVRCHHRPDGRFSIGLHVCKPKEFAPEPQDEPPQKISRLMQWSFFLFAAVGTAVVLIITARRLR